MADLFLCCFCGAGTKKGRPRQGFKTGAFWEQELAGSYE